MATRKITPWLFEEVQTFLSLIAEEKIQRELDGATRNENVYQEISELMAAHGYQRSFIQCREKFKNLKSDYWVVQMDAIYGRRPASNGRARGLDSALLESLVQDGRNSVGTECSTTTEEAPFVPERASTPTPQRVVTGKRKRSREQEHLSYLRDMQAADVEQQKLNRAQQEVNRAQREGHLQKAYEDAARAREQEAVLRREENAQTAAFNKAFIDTLRQLVQTLSGRRDPLPPPLD